MEQRQVAGLAPGRRRSAGSHDADPGHIVEQRGVQNKHGRDGLDQPTFIFSPPTSIRKPASFGFPEFAYGLIPWVWRSGFRMPSALLPCMLSVSHEIPARVRPLRQSLAIQSFVSDQTQHCFLRVGLGIPARPTAVTDGLELVHISHPHWATVRKTRDIYIRHRRVPLADVYCSVSGIFPIVWTNETGESGIEVTSACGGVQLSL